MKRQRSRAYIKDIYEKRNYLIEGTQQNELIIKNRRKIYTSLDYNEHLLPLASAVTGCISISTFAPLVITPIGITCRRKSLSTGTKT